MIRPARDEDYAAYAALFAELGIPDPVPSFARWRTELMPTTHVAERDGEVVGYVDCFPLVDTGYVRNIAVAARARNAGIGTALMRAAAAVLHARGMPRWTLNMSPDNAPARRLYERLGMQIDGQTVVLVMRWDDIAQLPADPADVRPLALESARELERRFGLLTGRLTRGSNKRGRVTVQLDCDGEPAGVTIFDPDAPGANLVCVTRPALIGTLLGALRVHARHDFTHLVIDRNDALAELLASHGAHVKLRLLQMSGALPL